MSSLGVEANVCSWRREAADDITTDQFEFGPILRVA